MPAESRDVPSAGRLIGEAVGHWIRHPRSFWPLGGTCTAGLGILKILALSGIGPSGFSGVVAITYIFVLDQWFKRFLFDDWTQRATLLDRNATSWTGAALPRWRFIAFCLGYCLLVTLAAVALFLFLAPGLFGGALTTNILAMSAASQAIAMLAGALAFGSFLLFLPASIAGLRWNLGDAFREATGLHLPLLRLALFSTFVSLLGPALLVGIGLLMPVGWLLLACQVLVILIDMIALHVLAYGVSRLFIAQTGWRAEPLDRLS